MTPVANADVIVFHDESGTVAPGKRFSHLLGLVSTTNLAIVANQIEQIRYNVDFQGNLKWSILSDNSRSRGRRRFAVALWNWFMRDGHEYLGLSTYVVDRSSPHWNDEHYGAEHHVYNSTLKMAIKGSLRYWIGDEQDYSEIVVLTDDRRRFPKDNFESYLLNHTDISDQVVGVYPVDADGEKPVSVYEIDVRDVFSVIDFIGGLLTATQCPQPSSSTFKQELIASASEVLRELQPYNPSSHRQLKRRIWVSSMPSETGTFKSDIEFPHLRPSVIVTSLLQNSSVSSK